MKKYKFRLQVVLELREKELEARQTELAKILTALNSQVEKLHGIINHQITNNQNLEQLFHSEELDIMNVDAHKNFGKKLIEDEVNQNRVISNTKSILQAKQKEVEEAYKKVEILKKLKEKEEKEYYQNFLKNEMKEIDDLTNSRYKTR